MTVQLGSDRSNLDLAGLVASRRPGYSLEAPFYVSRELFDLDVEAIFARHWVFAATEAEIREPGDYVTVEFGRFSIIIVRDDDENVRAFHNVCRHRGARILTDRTGSVGNIVCGYHQWTYGVGGELLYAENPPAGFSPSCFGLKTVAVRSVAGLVYICLAADPPVDFETTAATIEPYLAPHGLTHAKVAAQTDLVENGNWKLTMENNRECYHCGGHPELGASTFPVYGYPEDDIPPRLQAVHDRYQRANAEAIGVYRSAGLPYEAVELLGEVSGFRVQREPLDLAGESMTMDGRVACRRPMNAFPTAKLGRLGLHTQPNAWFHFMSDHAVTFCAIPLAPDRTLVRTTWLVHEEAVEGADYDVADMTKVWTATNVQDADFVELAQQGIESPAYQPGPYSPSEYQVEAFCGWYVDRLGEYLAR